MHSVSLTYASLLATALVALALADFGESASAASGGTLAGDKVRPSITTSASGIASIAVRPDYSISGTVTTSGLAASAVHIHTGTANENGPAVIALVRTGDDVWSIPDGAVLSEANFARYTKSELYVDVHTFAHSGGEIRGQISP